MNTKDTKEHLLTLESKCTIGIARVVLNHLVFAGVCRDADLKADYNRDKVILYHNALCIENKRFPLKYPVQKLYELFFEFIKEHPVKFPSPMNYLTAFTEFTNTGKRLVQNEAAVDFMKTTDKPPLPERHTVITGLPDVDEEGNLLPLKLSLKECYRIKSKYEELDSLDKPGLTKRWTEHKTYKRALLTITQHENNYENKKSVK